MKIEEIEGILDELQYKGWEFHIDLPGSYLQIWFPAQDVATGEWIWQHGRKWMLSHHMTKSELIQTALKAVLTVEEHEARENFLYRGRRVFGPHIDVEVLWDVCENTEVREVG